MHREINTAPHRGETRWRLVIAVLFAILGLLLAATPVRSEPVFSDFVRHPSVATQPASGQMLRDLAVKGGEIYMGYGDYGANTGPIDVATANLSTGATEVKITAATEEINTYREFGGSLYAPWNDPTVVGGIHSSDQNGAWANFGPNVENVHIFDVAVLPNGVQVAVGSANAADRSTFLGATAFVSYDRGQTWQIGMTDLTAPKDQNVSGFERYYWVAVIGGKAYMQARDNQVAYGETVFPVRVFDGTRWSRMKKQFNCFSSEGHLVEVFNGRAYCGNGWTFDGRSTTPSGLDSVADFHKHAGLLYAVQYGGQIWQNAGAGWTQVGLAPSGTRSIAVTDTHVYAGGSDGWVRRATR